MQVQTIVMELEKAKANKFDLVLMRIHGEDFIQDPHLVKTVLPAIQDPDTAQALSKEYEIEDDSLYIPSLDCWVG